MTAGFYLHRYEICVFLCVCCVVNWVEIRTAQCYNETEYRK